MEYGYLPKTNGDSAGNLRTEEQLKASVRALQKFAKIPATGEIDKATIELMKKPRCGLPDNPQASDSITKNRVKRYLIQGPKWSKTLISWR